MEIALQFTQERNPDIKFIELLSTFKWVFNNSPNTSTGHSLNEIIYGFKLVDLFGIATFKKA